MLKIMIEEKEWDQIEETDTVEGPIERVMREEVMDAFRHWKIERAAGTSEVYVEMILASRDVGISVLMEHC